MGVVTFSYDMVGYVDSCQTPHKAFTEDPSWGLSLMGLQTWNSVRALDFLISLDEVDPRRIGVTGASGGATQCQEVKDDDQSPQMSFSGKTFRETASTATTSRSRGSQEPHWRGQWPNW